MFSKMVSKSFAVNFCRCARREKPGGSRRRVSVFRFENTFKSTVAKTGRPSLRFRSFSSSRKSLSFSALRETLRYTREHQKRVRNGVY